MRTAVAFKLPPRAFVVLNSTTQPAILRYDGEERTVPARDTYVPGLSAKDSAGNPIPGSLVISDLFDGSKLKFTALDMLKHVFAMNDAGICTSMIWTKGVSPLDSNPSPEEVAAVDEAGRERWKTWEVRMATQLVSAHDSRNDARRRTHLPALAPNRDYMKAQAVLEAANAGLVAQYRAEFKIPEYLDETEAPVVRKSKPESVSNEDLVEEISGNPKLMRMLRAKLKGKKSAKGKVLAKQDQPKPEA